MADEHAVREAEYFKCAIYFRRALFSGKQALLILLALLLIVSDECAVPILAFDAPQHIDLANFSGKDILCYSFENSSHPSLLLPQLRYSRLRSQAPNQATLQAPSQAGSPQPSRVRSPATRRARSQAGSPLPSRVRSPATRRAPSRVAIHLSCQVLSQATSPQQNRAGNPRQFQAPSRHLYLALDRVGSHLRSRRVNQAPFQAGSHQECRQSTRACLIGRRACRPRSRVFQVCHLFQVCPLLR